MVTSPTGPPSDSGTTSGRARRGARQLHAEAPYDHFCFWARLPGITHEQTLKNVRLFASEVAPRVREAVGRREDT